jgi:hypothetical protein
VPLIVSGTVVAFLAGVLILLGGRLEGEGIEEGAGGGIPAAP